MCRKQRGFTLVTAIFIIVIVSALALFMVTIGSVQRSTATFSIIGPRAFFAAQSGLEWGAESVLSTGSCFAPATMVAPAGFSVAVTCAATPVVEGAASYSVFALTATATSGIQGREDFFSRTITASVSDAP
ncbi:MAG: pilus assembly protein MshP [Gammaproteobacteria bacterium]|nr:pilus assembly protein MshP [Gammaproteobacteria bacterium]NNM00714.1 pilus assembly protein MshP [Gammaproteobacteria bacterium]